MCPYGSVSAFSLSESSRPPHSSLDLDRSRQSHFPESRLSIAQHLAHRLDVANKEHDNESQACTRIADSLSLSLSLKKHLCIRQVFPTSLPSHRVHVSFRHPVSPTLRPDSQLLFPPSLAARIRIGSCSWAKPVLEARRMRRWACNMLLQFPNALQRSLLSTTHSAAYI